MLSQPVIELLRNGESALVQHRSQHSHIGLAEFVDGMAGTFFPRVLLRDDQRHAVGGLTEDHSVSVLAKRRRVNHHILKSGSQFLYPSPQSFQTQQSSRPVRSDL